MEDLSVSSNVVGQGGVFTASISKEWDVWGPNGGYLAALVLRAAGKEASFPFPRSLSIDFLKPARFEPATLKAVVLRRSSRAECIEVKMIQEDSLVVYGTVWTGPRLEGPHHPITRSDLPDPAEIPENFERYGEAAPTTGWRSNWDVHDREWIEVGDRYSSSDTPSESMKYEAFVKFKPTAVFEDPFADCGRATIVADFFPYGSLERMHRETLEFYIAPTLKLSVVFCASGSQSEYLYGDAKAASSEGFMSASTTIWSSIGELLAFSTHHSFLRSFPREA